MDCNTNAKLLKEAIEELDNHEFSKSLVRDDNKKLIKYYLSYDDTISQIDGRLGRGYYLTKNKEEALNRGNNVKEAYINADNIYNTLTRRTKGNGKNKAFTYGETLVVLDKNQIKFMNTIKGHKYKSKTNTNMRDFFEANNPKWEVKPSQNINTVHINTGNLQGDVEVFGDNIRVFTGDNTSGKGGGYDFYKSIWDYAKHINKKYTPSTDLSFVNQKRMTANMLKYYAENGGNKNIIIGKKQWGSARLAGKPLTDENAKKLAMNFVRKIEQEFLDKPINTMGSKELVTIGKELGSNENIRLGVGTIKRLYHYAKTGNILGLLSIPIVAEIIEGNNNEM